jgi:hypothetical protein
MNQQNTINSPGNEVPQNALVVIREPYVARETIEELLEPMAGKRKREWFNSHFYYCLPLSIGNQYGFIVRSAYDFTVTWNGGDLDSDVVVEWDKPQQPVQAYEGHFGSGILTVQNFWHYRTSPGVNIMTINPPNFFKRGITHMTGVVETDNLRRDFTFNLKITEPNYPIHFEKGEPVGAFITIPRYFADQFSPVFAEDIFTEEQLFMESQTNREFSRQRTQEDTVKSHGAGRRYFRGEDAWGKQFPDHQSFVERKR